METFYTSRKNRSELAGRKSLAPGQSQMESSGGCTIFPNEVKKKRLVQVNQEKDIMLLIKCNRNYIDLLPAW